MANKMPQPEPDAALDALDRGVIEAALTAAGAIACLSALEITVAKLREQFAAVYRLGMEHGSMIARGAARLASRFPQRWDGATGDAISAECRAAGVPSVNVRSRGGHGRGCRRDDVETAAGAGETPARGTPQRLHLTWAA